MRNRPTFTSRYSIQYGETLDFDCARQRDLVISYVVARDADAGGAVDLHKADTPSPAAS